MIHPPLYRILSPHRRPPPHAIRSCLLRQWPCRQRIPHVPQPDDGNDGQEENIVNRQFGRPLFAKLSFHTIFRFVTNLQTKKEQGKHRRPGGAIDQRDGDDPQTVLAGFGNL